MDESLPDVMLCWGKTGGATDHYHPVLFHMLDVGQVALQFLLPHGSPRWRTVLARALGGAPRSLTDWLPWVIALHDIGKISPPFQAQSESHRDRLAASGFDFGRYAWKGLPHHSEVGQAFLSEELDLPDGLRAAWMDMLGGHHGRFAGPDARTKTAIVLKAYEPPMWASLRSHAADILRDHLLRLPVNALPSPDNRSAASMALTGFTILCDWLGSDATHFPPVRGVPVAEYLTESGYRASRSLEAAGFLVPSLSAAPTRFAYLFPRCHPQRPLQTAVDRIPQDVLSNPCLAIIEAPTGEGKTEAALALAHRLAQASRTDEIYYALPTTATSDQMFLRLQRHLREGLGLPARAKLIHSQAFLVEDDLRLDPLGNGDGRSDLPALDWFGPRKRALLAPFGVGTIDQAELAALNAPHSALRMMGLAGKVLIVDEVHAYDVYMTTIIERLLQWLSALRTSVILLSATLPISRREKLIAAYGISESSTSITDYPLLWVGSQSGMAHHAQPAASQPNRTITLETLHFGEAAAEAKARWLLDAIASGGCAVWITNTVERSQQIYRALAALGGEPSPPVDTLLLHGRFPLDERQERERALREKYGPEGSRPARGIVVGTQVLEQSLDLDFDIMVSDLAPVDLLLQRAGRLHRHARLRPQVHSQPRLYINTDLDSHGCLRLEADRHVYSEFIIRQSWKVLQGRNQLHLPRDYRTLIEGVYAAPEPTLDSRMAQAWKELCREESEAAEKARVRLLPAPNPYDSFTGPAAGLVFEEDDNCAGWLVARTRLGEESLNVIPMERSGNTAWTIVDGELIRLDLDSPAPRQDQLRLLRRSLRVSGQAVGPLRQLARPRLFTESVLLRASWPLWLQGNQTSLKTGNSRLVLSLDPALGLVIERQKGG